MLAALGVFALVLPRLVNTPEFRAALSARASDALGSPVEWQALRIGILPPRVVLERPLLVGQSDSPEAEASIRAEAIDLRLSLMPLLERRIAIESLVLRGLDLVVSRTPEGFVLPSIGGGQDDPADPEPTTDAAFSLDLRELRVEEGSLLVHDRTLDPPVDWRLDSLAATARGESLGEPLAIEATARALAGDRPLGGVGVGGRVALAGEYDLVVELEEFAVAELRASLPDLKVEAGALSGRIEVAGGRESEGGGLAKVSADVRIAGLALETRGVALAGDLELRAARATPARTTFEVHYATPDAGGARISGERLESGDFALTAMLDALELAPFSTLAGEGRSLAGRATGEVSFGVESGAVVRVESDLDVDQARYADGRVDARGQLDVALGLEGLEPADSARLQAVFSPESGGRVDVNGTGTVAGAAHASLRFDALDLALLAPLWPEGTSVAGKLTGEVELETTAERELARLASRLRIGGARVLRAPVDVAGDLGFDARIEGEGPVALDARVNLEDGGRIELSGTSSRAGALALDAVVTNFDLAALTPFVADPELALAGRASGTGRVVGPHDALESLVLDLKIADAALRSGTTRLTGPFGLRLDLAQPLEPQRSGRLELDLDRAEVALGESFVKPAGVRAALATRLTGDADGGLAYEVRGPFHNISELFVRGATGPATSVELTTSAFELDGWSGLVPALADLAPSGPIAFEAFSLERREGEKDRFGGRIALRDVELTLAGNGRARVRGHLVGAGSRLESNALTASLHGLTLGLEGRIDDPLDEARFDFAAHSVGEAEANELVSGLTAARDVLFGVLRLDARLAGAAGVETGLLQTLAGNVRFTIGESGGGRLRGGSLLRSTLAKIPVVGGGLSLVERLAPAAGAPGVAVGADAIGTGALGDRFELLEADLAVASGVVDARTLRIRYRGHEARLAGRLTLEGLALDMRGELLLDSPLVARLAGRPESELAGRAPVSIPLARVTNTLSDPKVSLSPETLVAVPKLLLLTSGVGGAVEKAVGGVVGKATDKLGDAVGKLGEAAGKLGGGPRRGDETGTGKSSPSSSPVPAPVPPAVPPQEAPVSPAPPPPTPVDETAGERSPSVTPPPYSPSQASPGETPPAEPTNGDALPGGSSGGAGEPDAGSGDGSPPEPSSGPSEVPTTDPVSAPSPSAPAPAPAPAPPVPNPAPEPTPPTTP